MAAAVVWCGLQACLLRGMLHPSPVCVLEKHNTCHLTACPCP